MTGVQIPNRALFKAVEVCEIAQLQPYVLRSWETEFPDLGLTRTGASSRMYRRADVERVLQIKHLLFIDGLTLAGIRRRMEEQAAPVASDDLPLDELLGQNARERLSMVKQGLRGILDLLEGGGRGASSARVAVAASQPRLRVVSRRARPARRVAPVGKAAARKKPAPKGRSAKRKKR
jgi:DNA-binding transcriptional MerR regulator